MVLINEIAALREFINTQKYDEKSIGFVPTMGYLHDGHLMLMQEARKQCDIVVVSIFVNPLQFGINEDLSNYPRDLDRDHILCSTVPVDVIFAPSVSEIYPNGTIPIKVIVSELSNHLCGKSRIGHFDGVCTVLTKLFNIVSPHKVFLGRKDIQQLRIVETLVHDLNIPIEVIGCDTVRNENGLALSSRNAYLSSAEYEEAIIVPNLLKYIVENIQAGEFDVAKLLEKGLLFLNACKIAKLDYLQIVDYTKLQPLSIVKGKIIIATAIFIGKTRLIDNIIYDVKD